MKTNLSLLVLLTCLFIGISSCKKDEDGVSCELIPFNAFTLDQDKELGMQVASEIAADPKSYPILSESRYPESYAYLRKIRDNILNSGKVTNKSSFDWPVYIIKDDNTLNAFCTPGGYIYVYTGLIKYLDTEDDLAGVMGHEIAHADKRHSSKSMTTEYGLNTVLQIFSSGGDSSLVTTIASQLGTLKYSRCHESEADANSVLYLSGTSYRCNGAATFFQKLEAQGGSSTPVFLSTHPSPSSRIADINAKAAEKGCKTTGSTTDAGYAAFKTTLP